MLRREPIINKRAGVVKPPEPTADEIRIGQLVAEITDLRKENRQLRDREHTIANQAQKAVNERDLLRHEKKVLLEENRKQRELLIQLEHRVADLTGVAADEATRCRGCHHTEHLGENCSTDCPSCVEFIHSQVYG